MSVQMKEIVECIRMTRKKLLKGRFSDKGKL